ncbi:hypothetical protein EI94DRAFT_1430664, partial [Lactarius quietus]
LGHFNLFLGGVLHQDISCGNILRLQEPIKHLRLILGEDVDPGHCRGILIDGDHAIEWNEGTIASVSEPLGTVPFMSRRLFRARLRGMKVLHTAVDDLESFIWVLVC